MPGPLGRGPGSRWQGIDAPLCFALGQRTVHGSSALRGQQREWGWGSGSPNPSRELNIHNTAAEVGGERRFGLVSCEALMAFSEPQVHRAVTFSVTPRGQLLGTKEREGV